MRSVFLSTLFSLVFLAQLQTIEATETPVVIPTQAEGIGRYERTKNDAFSNLLSIEPARAQYDRCVAEEIPLEDMDICMWDGITKPDGEVLVPALSQEHKQEITAALKAYSLTPSDAPEVEGADPIRTEIEINSLASVGVENLTSTENAAYQKLQAYMEQKLKEALYGEVNAENAAQGRQFVDQKTFYDLYEAQVTKNLTMTISSFCLQVKEEIPTGMAKPSYSTDVQERQTDSTLIPYKFEPHFLRIPSDPAIRRDTIQENLRKVSQIGTNPTENSGRSILIGAFEWERCIKYIPLLCNYVSESGEKTPKYTREQACLVNRSLRAARQGLVEVKKIKDEFARIDGGVNTDNEESQAPNDNNRTRLVYDATSVDTEAQLKFYNKSDKDLGVDAVTTFTSGEVDDAENLMRQENQNVITRFEECSDAQGNFQGDMDKCAEFLSIEEDEQRQSLAEVSLRTRAVSQKISEMEEDEIKKYLEDEGYKDEEIDAMIAQAGGDINAVKARINEHYNNQREALISGLSKQIELRTITSGDQASPMLMREKLAKIHNELTTRVDDFKNLVHYNNIVSGFLTICNESIEDCDDPNREIRINSSMINREMANSAFSPENLERNPAQAGTDFAEHLSSLETNLEQVGATENSGSDGSVSLQVNEINDHFLRYFSTP